MKLARVWFVVAGEVICTCRVIVGLAVLFAASNSLAEETDLPWRQHTIDSVFTRWAMPVGSCH